MLRLTEKVAYLELDLEFDLSEVVCARKKLDGDFQFFGRFLIGEEGDMV